VQALRIIQLRAAGMFTFCNARKSFHAKLNDLQSENEVVSRFVSVLFLFCCCCMYLHVLYLL
jgi:hypothetical protein